MLDVFDTLAQIIQLFGTLAINLIAAVGMYLLPLVWIAWWLLAVNWRKCWSVLKEGGWVPLVLLMFLAAVVWSRLAPGRVTLFNLITLPNFAWQFGLVSAVTLVALFCGWLQGVFGWTPAEVSVEPPVHSGGDAHHH